MKCLIVGAGFSGLSAALRLSLKGAEVSLIESAPKAGGRASSFYDRRLSVETDNGQHLLSSCYKKTMDFLSMLGTQAEFDRFRTVRLLSPGGKSTQLSISKSPAGMAGMLRNKKLILRSIFNSEKPGKMLVLKTGLRLMSSSSEMLFPRVSLNELYVKRALDLIASRGGTIEFSQRVRKIIFKEERAVELICSKGGIKGFDCLILALPEETAASLLGLGISKPSYNPIISVSMKLRENPFKENLYAISGEFTDWLFNRGNHISINRSNAGGIISLEDQELIGRMIPEICARFPEFNSSLIMSSRVLRQRKATSLITAERRNFWRLYKKRPENLFIAGDWSDFSMPNTIEAAVRSGFKSADAALRLL